MKVTIENLGPLRKAEYEVGDLTLICGENNTGKTYATYALYGFLNYWRDSLTFEDFSEIISPEDIKTLMRKGSIILPINIDYCNIINAVCQRYSDEIYRVFGSSRRAFESAKFTIKIPSKRGFHKTDKLSFIGTKDGARTFLLKYDTKNGLLVSCNINNDM